MVGVAGIMGMCAVCCILPPLCCFSTCAQGAFARRAAVDHEHYREYMEQGMNLAFQVRNMHPPGTIIGVAAPPPSMETSPETVRRMSIILWFITLPFVVVGICLYIYLAFQCTVGSGMGFSLWPTDGPCWETWGGENYFDLGLIVACLLAIGCGGGVFLRVLHVALAHQKRMEGIQADYPEIIFDPVEANMSVMAPPGDVQVISDGRGGQLPV